MINIAHKGLGNAQQMGIAKVNMENTKYGWAKKVFHSKHHVNDSLLLYMINVEETLAK